MPSAVSPIAWPGSPGPDDLDKLLDYDNAVEDFMRDIPIGNGDQNDNTGAEQQPRDEDQEVQVKKKRQPVPKLDENRLLSTAGIPKLRKITKSRLKFRGKGHEFSDISRLLNTYQLWLDDLYPRAKFRDALAMVEKVGHSKRMQVSRKAWLDDTKPGRRGLTPDVEISGANGAADDTHTASLGAEREREESLFEEMLRDGRGGEDSARSDGHGDAPDDNDLDALLADTAAGNVEPASQTSTSKKGPFAEDGPDDDELDALLAETKEAQPAQNNEGRHARGPFEEEPDDDDLDALMAEQTTDSSEQVKAAANVQTTTKLPRDDFADDEEAMASMQDMW